MLEHMCFQRSREDIGGEFGVLSARNWTKFWTKPGSVNLIVDGTKAAPVHSFRHLFGMSYPAHCVGLRQTISVRLTALTEPSLIIPLGVPSYADFSRIAPRNEDEIDNCQGEPHGPPKRGDAQRLLAGSGRIGGHGILWRQSGVEHHRENCGSARGQ